MLGVENMQALEAAADGTGFGVVGELAQPMAVEEFFALLRSTLGCKAVRHSKVVKSEIQRIAICTGAGGSLIEQAAQSGCDVYVTADVKYNQYYLPDG
jgi:putative NIF3 family GTP cyclohydrolase 1 type 2